MHITTLFFDLGEVILTNDWTFVCPDKDQEFFDTYGIREFSYVKNPYFADFMVGKMSRVEYWTQALKFFQAKNTDPQQAMQIQHKYQKAYPGMLELLLSLKHNSYKLGVISTIDREFFDWKRKTFELDKYFDEYITSGYSGFKKPEVEIYKLALLKMNVSATESIFVDDKVYLVAPAEKLGMTGVVFNAHEGVEKLKDKLKEFDITLFKNLS